MLIFILIDVQYSQKAFLALKKFELSKSLLLRFPSSGKKSLPPPVKFPIPPPPNRLPLFGRTQFIKLYGPFLWMGYTCLKSIQSRYEETVYFLPEILGTH